MELMFMSDSQSGSFNISQLHNGNDGVRSTSSRPRSAGHAANSAIDMALRTVPLPDGLLTRLAMIIRTMPDDAPDQVDWLGC
jgi:hypothetical protein